MFIRRRQESAPPEPSGPYWRQRGWQWSAGFLAAALLVGGVTVLVTGGADRRGTADSGGPLSATPGEDGRPRGCRTDDSDTAVPDKAPADVRWRTLGVTRVPVSAASGPTRTDGGMWWCFARTPVGAVLAAHVIPSQLSEKGWQTVVEQQVVPGRGRDLFKFQRSTFEETDNRDAGGSVAYAGFSVISYSASDAKVTLLLRTGSGYAATTISLRWNGGDWKLLPSSQGSLHTPVTLAQGPRGHILWEA